MAFKIGLTELLAHHEVLRVYLLGFLMAEAEVYCYTNVFNHQLQNDLHDVPRLYWRVKEPEQSNEQFLNQHQEEINQLDYWLFTTYVPLKELSSFHPNRKAVLLHSLNTFFQPSAHLFSGKDLSKLPLRLLKLPLTWYRHYQLRNWTRFLDEIVVGTESVFQYLNQQKFNKDFPIRLIEMYYNEKIAVIRDKGPLRIGIPGNINPGSRDYELLLRVFHQIEPTLDEKVNLIFPSLVNTNYARNIKKGFEELGPKLSGHFFEHYLDQEEYDQLLLDTDFLICPIKPFTYNGSVRDINSKTHVTATVNDTIRLGIPAVFPRHYELPQALDKVVGKYTTETDLQQLLQKWIKEKIYNRYKQQMAVQLQPYAEAQTRQRFQSYVNSLKQIVRP